PLLIRVGGELAGFALVNTHCHLGEEVDFNLADFFIAREYRGLGIATEAVRLMMMQYPGRWEIAVAEHNMAARMFWSRTVGATPNIWQVVRHEGAGRSSRGPIWSFRSVAGEFGPTADEKSNRQDDLQSWRRIQEGRARITASRSFTSVA